MPDADRPTLRDAAPGDRTALLRLIGRLQELERSLDPRLPPAHVMAERYLAECQERIAEYGGCIVVAIADGSVHGMVVCFAKVPFTEADDPRGSFALVHTLAVDPEAEGRGLGRALLAEGEARVRAAGASEIRVEFLVGNDRAAALYAKTGYAPYLEVRRKLIRA